MQFLEYYSSALRHLDVCKLMLEKLSTMGVKKEKQRQRLMLDTQVSDLDFKPFEHTL